MSILYSSKFGWLLSHKAAVDGFFKTTPQYEISLKESLFQTKDPYKTNNKRSKKVIPRLLSDTEKEIEEEIKFINSTYALFLKDLQQSGFFGDTKDLEHTNEEIKSNSVALEVADAIYKETDKVDLKNINGVNIGSSLVRKINSISYLFPENVKFYCQDVSNLLHYINDTYDLILLDPPWWNKYIRRKRAKSGIAYSMMYDDDLVNIPLEKILKDDGLIVVWCTNSRRHQDMLVNTIFKKWNVEFFAKWYWVKVTTCGETVCKFSEPCKKQPFEQIIFGCKKPRVLPKPEHQKLVLSVPSALHSHKPPLKELLASYLPENPSCLELFARYLVPGWTSYGFEAIRLQHECLFDITNKQPP